MGRALLIVAAAALLAALLAACAPAGEPPAARAVATDPHAGVTCAACHQGAQAAIGLGRATVPRESCTTAGCHEDAGPELVTVGTATFRHRNHGASGAITTSCAGCHTHTNGDVSLEASVDACALCHTAQLASSSAEDCRLCHQKPAHATLTSQGVPVPHAKLPWIETGCVRCHYDVADAPTGVPASECAGCHRDVAAVAARGIAEDLHPIHIGLTCTACHQSGAHRVRAMSSAVDLVCADCHRAAHALPLTTAEPAPALCADCHDAVHLPQQRLLLGMLPDGAAAPSSKFLAGVTCRSCHIPPVAGPVDEPIRGQAEACAGCHGSEYRVVLRWWLDGLRDRQRRATEYVELADAMVGARAPDSARALVGSARELLALVAAAGGQHNLELSDRIFRESVQRAAAAVRLADAVAPTPPDLGTRPHAGLCTYCHYAPDDPWNLREMPAGFHRNIVRGSDTR